jgi:predicted RNase H-like HicB family nuclease
MKKNNFIAIIEQDEDGLYVGSIPSLRSCYTQAKTLSELYKRLEEVAELSMEIEKQFFKKEYKSNVFIGVQQLAF